MLSDDSSLLSKLEYYLYRNKNKIMLNSKWKWFFIIAMTCLLVLLINTGVEAQCPMCRMSGETNLKNGGTAAAGLNKGIIYLLSIPYILFGTVSYLWWKNKKAVKKQELQQEIESLLVAR